MENSGSPEDAVVVPREIAESDDVETRAEWLREHNKNGVFAFEYGTECIKACIYDREYGDVYDYSDNEIFKKIYIPDTVTEICDAAFGSCSYLTSVTMGNSVTKIGNDAFAYCISLTSVTIGSSVTEIGCRAFQFCQSLTSITIPDSVTTIGQGAFLRCRGLTSITIPKSVTMIDYDALLETSLKTVYLPRDCKIVDLIDYDDIYDDDDNGEIREYEKFGGILERYTEVIRY